MNRAFAQFQVAWIGLKAAMVGLVVRDIATALKEAWREGYEAGYVFGQAESQGWDIDREATAREFNPYEAEEP